MNKAILFLTALALPTMVNAQTVPALDAPIATSPEARVQRVNTPPVVLTAQPPTPATPPTTSPPASPQPPVMPNYPPPSLSPLSAAKVKLTPRENEAVSISRSWQNNRAMPTHGMEGAVVFGFGETLPSIICAPLFVCDVQLQPGELVNDIMIGDSVRWKISPAASGTGPSKTTHVLIKPADTGLTTNLVITTDRRVYVLKLVSQPKEWMARVAFTYPEEQRAEWENFLAAQRAEAATRAAVASEARRATTLPTGESIQRLDFGFEVKGDKPSWRPVRVYSDGRKTYIEFPETLRDQEAPALVAVGEDNKPEIMNYRVDGDRYVVDQVVQRVALISGVGRRQVKVEIQRARRG